MMMSPLRIFTLYKQFGFVQTHALNWIEAPWLPKSESGTKSPAPHFRQRGNANSTPIAPLLERHHGGAPTTTSAAPGSTVRATLHYITVQAGRVECHGYRPALESRKNWAMLQSATTAGRESARPRQRGDTAIR